MAGKHSLTPIITPRWATASRIKLTNQALLAVLDQIDCDPDLERNSDP